MPEIKTTQVGTVVFGGGLKPTAALDEARAQGLIPKVIKDPRTQRWLYAELHRPQRGNN